MTRLAALVLLLSLGSCDSSPTDDVPHVGDAPLAGGLPSLQVLGEAVVAGLVTRDADALAALAIGEEEYTGRLFPALASHPAAEAMGRALLWDMHARQSRDDLRGALDRYGGEELRFVRFEPRRQVRRAGVVFHERPRVIVRDAAGEERSLQLLASVIEHEPSGTFKLLGFRDHD